MTTTRASSPAQSQTTGVPAPAGNPAAAPAVAVMLSSLTPCPPPDPEVDEWAEKINHAAGYGVAWLVSAGMHLNLAKAALDHGRWQGMFDSGKIKMGVRSAQLLMKIAGNPAIANAQDVTELPPTLTALSALSSGSVAAVKAGIQSGAIHPGMTAKQAREFVSSLKDGPPTAKPATSFDSDKRRNRVQQAFKKEALKWPDDARCQLADLLEVLAKDIRASLPATHH